LPRERLVVVGSGPDEARLHELAPRNVTFLSEAAVDVLRWHYATTQALVCASLEDFALTPIEAAAMGRHTVALRFGGYLDTIVPGRTGAFCDRPEPADIARAVWESRRTSFEPAVLRAHAQTFSQDAFERSLRAVLA